MRDAVIVGAVRTPIGRRDGKLAGLHATDLLGHALGELLARTGVDPEQVDDVIAGCVTQVGEQSTNIARNAWLAAGLPESVPGTTVDRQCGSSQQAVHFAAQGVMSGAYDLVVACGVESMSRVPMCSNTSIHGRPYSDALESRYDGRLVPQGLAAELVCERWGIGRAELDEVAVRSHELAGRATAEGAFEAEIAPLDVESESGRETVTADEGIRVPDRARMAALPPAFKEDGVVTAANTSQIADGAAAVLIASREKAEQLSLRPRARFVAFAVVGSDPVLMLTGPIPATRTVLERSGLSLDDVDLVEINEAFACAPIVWRRELGIDDAWFNGHVNVHGGAIAVGHPLGATGARLTTTLLHALERTGGRIGLQTICEGGGLANAMVIERLGTSAS